MKKSEIKAMFPLKAMVTQEIIDSARIFSTSQCIGAKTLRSVLPDELKNHVSWAVTDSDGTFGNLGFNVTTIEGFDMMNIKEPCEVTFILRDLETLEVL